MTDDQIESLATLLPAGLSRELRHNPHKMLYQSAQEYLDITWADDDVISAEDRAECIRTDEIWELQWYPDTPVGFCLVIGPTLASVLRRAQ